MATLALFEERVIFSPHMDSRVNALLQSGVAAAGSNPERAEHYFMQAQQQDPQCLQTYFALYKFYFYQARLLAAENAAHQGLQQAARQGGFDADYRRLLTSDWHAGENEAAWFYLYTLKALAFIKLRLDDSDSALSILRGLQRLDPTDRCGSSVIMSLALALEQEP
jgi:hypothetical protein